MPGDIVKGCFKDVGGVFLMVVVLGTASIRIKNGGFENADLFNVREVFLGSDQGDQFGANR